MDVASNVIILLWMSLNRVIVLIAEGIGMKCAARCILYVQTVCNPLPSVAGEANFSCDLQLSYLLCVCVCVYVYV